MVHHEKVMWVRATYYTVLPLMPSAKSCAHCESVSIGLAAAPTTPAAGLLNGLWIR